MIAYSLDHEPPAPVVEITIANTLNRRLRQVMPALLDTGADITAIPHHTVEPLQLYPIGRLQFEDLHAETSYVFTYKVRIAFEGLSIPQLEVIPTGLDFAIIGRDVLNRYDIQLNGPALSFAIKG